MPASFKFQVSSFKLRTEVSTGNGSDRVGTHASGVLALTASRFLNSTPEACVPPSFAIIQNPVLRSKWF